MVLRAGRGLAGSSRSDKRERPARAHARVGRPSRHGLAPVVCVHGPSVSSRYMVPTRAVLAERRRALCARHVRLRRSQHPREILGIPALAEALARRMGCAWRWPSRAAGQPARLPGDRRAALRWPERVVATIALTGPTMDRRALSVFGQASRRCWC